MRRFAFSLVRAGRPQGPAAAVAVGPTRPSTHVSLLPRLRVDALGPVRPMVQITHSGRNDGEDEERQLAELQMSVREQFARGEYATALDLAADARDRMKEYFGADHPVVASSYNNLALCNKMLGNYEAAIDDYLQAVSTYRETSGEQHPHTVSTLSNLGLCFQAAALSKKGVDRMTMMDRAVEALEEAAYLSREDQKPRAQMHLAVARVYASPEGTSVRQGTLDDATKALRSTLQFQREKHTAQPNGTTGLELAYTLNNLGFVLKQAAKHEQAHGCYTEAIELRTEWLGREHPDTINSLFNLAENFTAMGDDGNATKVQEEILAVLDKKGLIEDDVESGGTELDGAVNENRG